MPYSCWMMAAADRFRIAADSRIDCGFPFIRWPATGRAPRGGAIEGSSTAMTRTIEAVTSAVWVMASHSEEVNVAKPQRVGGKVERNPMDVTVYSGGSPRHLWCRTGGLRGVDPACAGRSGDRAQRRPTDAEKSGGLTSPRCCGTRPSRRVQRESRAAERGKLARPVDDHRVEAPPDAMCERAEVAEWSRRDAHGQVGRVADRMRLAEMERDVEVIVHQLVMSVDLGGHVGPGIPAHRHVGAEEGNVSER